MENVIYNELIIRGYSVDVGVIDRTIKTKENKYQRTLYEVDFVANKGSKRIYIQSALSLSDPEKMKQEQRSILSINDAFEKILIQRNYCKTWYTENGIKVMCLENFLLSQEI